jgi:hypothetical protein
MPAPMPQDPTTVLQVQHDHAGSLRLRAKAKAWDESRNL